MVDNTEVLELDQDVEVEIAEDDGSERSGAGLLLLAGAAGALAIREGAGFIWRKTADKRAELKEKREAKKAERAEAKEAKAAEKEAKKASKKEDK